MSTASASEFEVIFSRDTRPLFAILGLLLYLIAIRAADVPAINDSEAFQYVGKAVEVRGLVVAVLTSPLETAFINFGREYPNQTFAGSIASVQGSLTLVARKTILLLMAALA